MGGGFVVWIKVTMENPRSEQSSGVSNVPHGPYVLSLPR